MSKVRQVISVESSVFRNALSFVKASTKGHSLNNEGYNVLMNQVSPSAKLVHINNQLCQS